MLEPQKGAASRRRPVLVPPTRGGAARPVTAAPDGHWRSHQRIQLAPELKFYKPVEVVHLY